MLLNITQIIRLPPGNSSITQIMQIIQIRNMLALNDPDHVDLCIKGVDYWHILTPSCASSPDTTTPLPAWRYNCQALEDAAESARVESAARIAALQAQVLALQAGASGA